VSGTKPVQGSLNVDRVSGMCRRYVLMNARQVKIQVLDTGPQVPIIIRAANGPVLSPGSYIDQGNLIVVPSLVQGTRGVGPGSCAR